MSEMLNWGIMGNATIARVCVIPAIQKSGNGTVHAMASRMPQHAADVRRKNNISKLYGDYEALIEDPAIEAVYIPLPNHLHHEWTLKALTAGKHVLCEKPLACNARRRVDGMLVSRYGYRILLQALVLMLVTSTSKMIESPNERPSPLKSKLPLVVAQAARVEEVTELPVTLIDGCETTAHHRSSDW